MNSVAGAQSRRVDAFLMLLDIIGSNASRQTTREISYRLVAALALFMTAYSWNAQSLLIARDTNLSRTQFIRIFDIATRIASAPRMQLMRHLSRPVVC